MASSTTPVDEYGLPIDTVDDLYQPTSWGEEMAIANAAGDTFYIEVNMAPFTTMRFPFPTYMYPQIIENMVEMSQKYNKVLEIGDE
jgi:hypothetical protein